MSEENEEYFVSKEQMFFQALKVAAYANNEITRLREENKKLREALNPFADAWEDREIWQSIIDIDDLRAAAAAIRESENETI